MDNNLIKQLLNQMESAGGKLMRKLLRLVKPYWYLVLLGPMMMAVEVLSELAQPRLMAKIIDQGIAKGDLPFVVRTGGLMLLIALGGVFFGFGSIILSSIASQRFGADLRERVFTKVLYLPTANLDKFSTGAVITRLTQDVNQMQQLVMIMMRMLIRAPMLCFGSLAMAIAMSRNLSTVLVVAIPTMFLIMALIQMKGMKLFRKMQQKLDRVNTVLQENLAGIRLVRAFGRHSYERERFQTENDALKNSGKQAMRVMGLMDPLMTLGMNVTIVFVVWFGGTLVNSFLPDGSSVMEVGQVMAFISYMSQILFALVRNGVLVNALARSKASADRINEILDTQPAFTQPQQPITDYISQGRVEFCNVSFRYPTASGLPVLRNISFTAEPGQTTAIIGTTGSGKSTLVSLIPRLYDVLEGAVLIDGVDVRDYDLAGLRSGIGMVMQDSMLFSGSIEDNLRWGSRAVDETQIQEAAQVAEADNFISKLSDGYSSVIGQRGSSLSGGQKQRLSMARALVRQPKILILDDSTSAVDMGTEARIQQALRGRTATSTVIIIAQRVSSIMDADQIIVLEEGKVDGIGTHQELMRSNAVYRDIVHSQFGLEVAGNDN